VTFGEPWECLRDDVLVSENLNRISVCERRADQIVCRWRGIALRNADCQCEIKSAVI
jgi:hypothetical protein